jgi:uncharacterized protein YtpQ (UPF0354 family)
MRRLLAVLSPSHAHHNTGRAAANVAFQASSAALLVTLAACGGAANEPPATAAATASPDAQAHASNASTSGRASDVDARPSADEPDETSPRGFTERVARDLEARIAGARVTVTEPLTLRVQTRDGQSLEVSLDRPWSTCERRPRQCTRAARDYVDAVAATITADTKVSADDLRVACRSRDDVTGALARNPDVIATPWLGDFWMVLAFDFPQSIRYAAERDLSTLKLGRDEAIERGRANTARLVGGGTPRDIGPIHAFAGDPYEASRLLVGTNWARLANTVRGELIVTAPTRDFVAFTGTKEKFGLSELRGLAAHVKGRSDVPLSTTVLKWTPTGFHVVSE